MKPPSENRVQSDGRGLPGDHPARTGLRGLLHYKEQRMERQWTTRGVIEAVFWSALLLAWLVFF